MERQMVVVMAIWAIGLAMLSTSDAGRVNAMSCTEAWSTLSPCMPFLVGTTPNPSMACCSGVSAVKAEASTPEIRKQFCECFKSSAASVDPGQAKNLAGLCGLRDFIPIDPIADCSKVPA